MVSCDGGVMDDGACSMDEVAWDALDVDAVVALLIEHGAVEQVD